MDTNSLEIDTDNIGSIATTKSYCQAIKSSNQPIKYSVLSRTLLCHKTQNCSELDILSAIEDAGLDDDLEGFQIIRNGTMIELVMKSDRAKSLLQDKGLCVNGVIHRFHNSTPTRNISKRIAVSVIGLPLEKKEFPVGKALEDLGYGKHIHTRPVFKKTPKNKTPYFSGILVVIIDNILKPIPRNLRLRGYNLRIVYTGQDQPKANLNEIETQKTPLTDRVEKESTDSKIGPEIEKKELNETLINKEKSTVNIETAEPIKVANPNDLAPQSTKSENNITTERGVMDNISTEDLEEGEITILEELEDMNHLEIVEFNWKAFKNFDRYNCSEEELNKLKRYKKAEWDEYESERRNYRALEKKQQRKGMLTPISFKAMDSGEMYSYNKKEFKNYYEEDYSTDDEEKYVAHKKAEWDQRRKEFTMFIKDHEKKQKERQNKLQLNLIKKEKRQKLIE